ncbi:uncharacterized protein OCT59_001347 [Rhizophagus irregularis]|uniref:uncharacterized protein n=1 Tax=Rhizophagus irregularis TaxID=588596 RepID=UPI0033306C31|nr:hypothetical protein OCT59_001347 [Rhizophagus irregularis]
MDHTIWFQTPNNANVGESAHANINCDGRDISLLSGIGRQWEIEQRSASTTISTTLTPITQNSNFHWTNLTLYRHPD